MSVTTLFIRVIVYVLVMLGIYGAIVYDATTANFEEASWTEYCQEFMLLVIIVVSFLAARRYTRHRLINISLAASATVFLIREFNNFAYEHLFPYAWQVGALLVLIPFLTFIARNFRSFLRELTEVANTYPFAILLIGMLVLQLFSRLYGLPFWWQELMGDGYIRMVMRASEESIELLGYSILCIGACEFYLFTKQQSTSASYPPLASV